ncbi:MAG: DNA methyltransferase [Omnitrophica bacterium RIFCSPLOWO2_12_FULL_44_17]|uniref:Methyltransferase n=1 Tax=Candidatus Danuiimicrobium aquiferis TaxID=1801832 RepID=A0A1G1KQC6_9BACT|nr:MAG: DNA methyltransferase [Omnitrophica bacterium RIFCSPHIGHO2_02_FULL_45_28]OGW90935.1 MAG: DNA methyltransferase [Omnitrophica bacterium RIFCSPHIGHO2_12_FULL_44_12]OGW95140.1 MAG: DNA methyltransferase [Omnitrophica bacterium RIFCSPLOWO2_12_FULL_44_17]OGX01716.1 MAG: DNA methyltransferase [Omnitrophica bacterium RIFCSPLOWO2_02_FULL_44_11]
MNTLSLFEDEKRSISYTFEKGSVFERLHFLADESIDLTITSPPYNVGKAYEKKTDLNKYLEPYKDFAIILFKKTSETGHLCWEVGNYVEDSEVFPLDTFYYHIFKEAGFKLRNRIIWHFEHGLHATKRLSGRYETILWFSKSDDYVFNLDNIRVPAKYPGKRSWKGKDKGKPSGNPLGKNPSDFWRVTCEDWEKEIWEIPNVKSNHPEKTMHPCQFPIELVQRCVLALTNEGDLVLDPFMGVGSAAIASTMHNRKFIGFDTNDHYIKIAEKRMLDFKKGVLKIRPLGKPIHQPTGKEKVSQIPEEWRGLLCK